MNPADGNDPASSDSSPASTGAIILAAGRSSRMGTPKALLHLDGRRVLERLVAGARDVGLSPIVVVGHGPALALAESIEDVEAILGDPDQPMIDSIVRGLEQVANRAGSVIIQPVDAPFTTAEMLNALLDGRRLTSRVLCHEGRPGHPVLVPRSLFAEIRDRPEGGLRRVLGEHDVELVEWNDDRVLADLDTPEDLERWQNAAPGRLH